MPDYRSGTCNIGGAERQKRLLYGSMAFLGAGMVLAGPSLATGAGILAFATLATLGFLGIFQYRQGFCAGFALAGVYDVSAGGATPQTVTDPDDRRADRRAAAVMFAASLGAGILLTAIVVVLR